MKTSELFTKEIEYISDETLKKIVVDTLDASPECIQTIPASSSESIIQCIHQVMVVWLDTLEQQLESLIA